MSRLRKALPRRLVAELAAFGTVGAICLIADVVLFNVFAFVVGMTPVLAKCVGLVITGLMAYFGHRHVTFRHRHGGGYRRELPRFVAVTVVTVVLSLLPLYLARHVAGLTSVLALNVANIVGIALGTAARYLAYRFFVWTHLHEGDAASGVAPTAPVSGGGVVAAGSDISLDDPRGRGLLEVQHELVRE